MSYHPWPGMHRHPPAPYTAWGRDGVASLLIGGVGPPGPGRWSDEAEGGPAELIWTIRARSWQEAATIYNELQGWGPYVPHDGVRRAGPDCLCEPCYNGRRAVARAACVARVGRRDVHLCPDHARDFCRAHGADLP